MNTYYLVDFENVGNEGMNGCEGLTSDDHIYLFFTENVKSINMNIVGNHGGAKFSVLKVPTGKQSADMHIVSVLGYLIGKNKDGSSKYVIISKDTDYDNVIKFWQEKKKISISKAEKIAGAKKKNNKAKKAVVQSQKTAVPNAEMLQELKKAKGSAEIIEFVTSCVLKHKGEKNNKNTVYQMLVAKYGQTQGLNWYKIIKKFL